MTVRRTVPRRQRPSAGQLLALLQNREFRRETRAIISWELRGVVESGVLDTETRQVFRLGFMRWSEENQREAERLIGRLTAEQATALAAYWARMRTFVGKWGVVPPLFVEAVGGSRRAARRRAILSGQWGLIPVFSWTRAEDVRAATSRIQRRIGRQHRDARSVRQGAQAVWMQLCGVSRSEIAKAIWGRDDANRPSRQEAVRKTSVMRERQLYERHQQRLRQKLGREPSRPEIIRAVFRTLQGSEAPARVAVRMAEKRFLDSIHATRVESATNHDPASYAATMLLRPGLHLRKRPSVEELRARIKEFYEVLVAHPARP